MCICTVHTCYCNGSIIVIVIIITTIIIIIVVMNSSRHVFFCFFSSRNFFFTPSSSSSSHHSLLQLIGLVCRRLHCDLALLDQLLAVRATRNDPTSLRYRKACSL